MSKRDGSDTCRAIPSSFEFSALCMLLQNQSQVTNAFASLGTSRADLRRYDE
jgi:hypothetical protein